MGSEPIVNRRQVTDYKELTSGLVKDPWVSKPTITINIIPYRSWGGTPLNTEPHLMTPTPGKQRTERKNIGEKEEHRGEKKTRRRERKEERGEGGWGQGTVQRSDGIVLSHQHERHCAIPHKHT